ncbi:TlpA family protein disulfide reductase [Bizionia psychrotolerans]|uniref:TlpA family protein disulfide reductase n=1 Tax=Bizionia psychrotolerans TaxID=1492901 RepID=UPI0006515572|nr:TlpA disulfide reductase family protein [Bizionia psychrotolerans]
MKKATLLFVLLITISSFSQKKKLWAKSFINKEAPEFVVEEWLTDIPNMEGKFVLIDFWATWCGPCKKAIPEMNKFHEEFKDDLVVIGLSDESKAKVLKQVNPKMDYYSAIDTQKRLNTSYKVQGIPHCVIINPKGIVVWEGWPGLKGHELTSEVIKELIDKG